MAVIRSDVGQYVSIPCAVFSLGLSPHALSLLVYALSRPDWFEFCEKDVIASIQIGRTTLHKAIDELRQHGLVTGSFRTGLTFYDTPDSDTPSPAAAPQPEREADAVCSPREQETQFVRVANKESESLFATRTKQREVCSSREQSGKKFVRLANNSSNSLLLNKNNKTTTGFFPEISRPCRAEEVRDWFDFSSDSVADLRRQVVRALWCPNLRADVIDRATAAILLFADGATLDEYRRLRTEAGYRETDTRPAWAIVNLAITKLYDAIGWEYGPTRIGDEPRPTRPKQPDADDDAQTVKREALTFADQAGITPDDNYDSCLTKLANTTLTPMARPSFAKLILQLRTADV